MRIINVSGGFRIAPVLATPGTNDALMPTWMRPVWSDEFVAALEERGELTLVDDGHELERAHLLAQLRAHDVAIVGWDAHVLPAELADDPGDLRYICCYSGTIRNYVPRELIASGLTVTNWGDHPAQGVAEAAMTLLLGVLHQVPVLVRTTREGGFGIDPGRSGLVLDLAVGIYGCGVIARRHIEMLRPFRPRIRVFDPYVDDLPDGVERADTLAELCDWAEALVIHAGWSEETDRSVTADHLARLPDGGVVVNTARGGIINQDALFAELESGRLRAGLDVLEPDELAPDHPIRRLDNVLLSFHQGESENWPVRPGLTRMQRRVLDQLDRFAAGEPLDAVFDLDRYDRST